MHFQLSCPICESQLVSAYYRAGAVRPNWQDGCEWNVFRCGHCGHGFVFPQPDETVLNSYYSRQYDAFGTDHGTQAPIAALVEQARETGRYRHITVEKGLRILDVGCGGGSFLAVCQKLGADVMGVEPSELGVESCKKNDVTVFHGTLAAFLENSNETYDLVTANHVVEHHPDPVQLLSEMRSATRPEGEVWISVPNAGCFFSRALKGAWHSSDLPVHLHHFTTTSAKRLLESADLQVQSLRTESENSLGASLAQLLKKRAFIPRSVTRLLLEASLRKNGSLGRRIDASENGEAILISGKVA